MYLLDTNICIALLKGNSQVVGKFQQAFPRCYLSTIAIAELYKGVYCSQKVDENLENLQEFIQLLSIVEFDLSAALEFGKIQLELRRIGKPTGEIDAIIAAVARSQNFILVTDNIRHFENISNLELENWIDN